MVDSRVKGRAGEQELVRLLKDELGDKLEITRVSHLQAGSKPLCDVFCGNWDIEVKRYKRPTEALIRVWWDQTIERHRQGQLPCLAYRGDAQLWRFMTPMWKSSALYYTQTHYLEGFAMLVRESLPVSEAMGAFSF